MKELVKKQKYLIRKNDKQCYTNKTKRGENMSNSEQLSKKLMTIGGGKTLTKTPNKMDKLIPSCVDEVKIKLQDQYGGNKSSSRKENIFKRYCCEIKKNLSK